MSAARHIELISVDEYLAGELVSPVKHEYAGGYVYAMAGARNIHNSIATSFIVAAGSQLRGKPCQPFNSDTKVRVRLATHTRFYYPDAMIVCEPNAAGDTFQDQPVVLAEVVSSSTRRVDEGEKRDAYLAIPTLSAYLLIESTRPRVVVHHRVASGFVARQYEGITATIPLEELGIELALADLYERVDFDAAVSDDSALSDDAVDADAAGE